MATADADRRVEIDSIHSAAICREIGNRLDRYFEKDAPSEQASPELQRLLTRLHQLDEAH